MYTASIHYREQPNMLHYVYWPGAKKTRRNRKVYELFMSVTCLFSLSLFLTHFTLSFSFPITVVFSFCHPYSCCVSLRRLSQTCPFRLDSGFISGKRQTNRLTHTVKIGGYYPVTSKIVNQHTKGVYINHTSAPWHINTV